MNSFHICLDNDPDHVKWRDEEVYQILKRCKELKALLMVHAENGTFIEEVREDWIHRLFATFLTTATCLLVNAIHLPTVSRK